jgi:hypothetical protein
MRLQNDEIIVSYRMISRDVREFLCIPCSFSAARPLLPKTLVLFLHTTTVPEATGGKNVPK